jgi:ribose 5-phosphate isomerase A
MELLEAKKNAGYKAAELVEQGMTVGLGTGSTVHFFLEKLVERIKLGLQVKAVASSEQTAIYAKQHGIPLVDINTLTHLDLTIDGADEIDEQMRLIKGGGGALLREKILAYMSHKMIVIADETKLCSSLGKSLLPIEITPFAVRVTQRAIDKLVDFSTIRKQKDGSFFLTDNGNFIIDAKISTLLKTPELLDLDLKSIPGVIETGFFFNLATSMIISFLDGNLILRSK